MARRGFPGAKAPDKPTKFVLPNRLFALPVNEIQPTEGVITVAGIVAALILTLAPSPGSIAVAGNAPSITQSLAPAAAQVIVGGQVPALSALVLPTEAQVIVSGQAPSIAQALILSPAEAQVIVSGQVPSFAFQLLPSDGSVVVSGYVPTVSQIAPSTAAESTPGFRIWAEAVRGRLHREREELDLKAQEPRKQPDLSAYHRQSARLTTAILAAQAEVLRLREQIAQLEALAAAAAEAERARLEHQLLLEQQRLILAAAQEAMLLAEIEALDVAFIAVLVVMVLS